MSLSAETVEKAIKLLYKNAQKQLDAAKIIMELLEQHEDKIRRLTERVEQLEAANAHEEERKYQENLNELDRQDGEWYRQVNDLG